ncbi:ZmpA/ZmpB/ZmpC family metallo-endopeptidase [Streptococcus pseudopneumoniae]|uniref:ZmpA/ZmpB/ZmpC family metallo-endopeptidase n=1 Tax=Streptococcus pseudopneumoniae TaxID=257758 RepID=UPI00066E469D|nr:ZmpA/ZmpB/ZmpC family metallo-endopeptidase [Streptococcus pseudopneumoniae]
MRKTKQQLEKITKYSIRKLTVGVGPVAIGAFLFGASTLSVDKVQANEVGGAHSVHYRYLAEQELTKSEKALIHHEVPTEFQDDDILYVVYRKKATNSQQLPYTGSKELALAGLGLATASLAVFLVSKKGRKEVLGVLLIGSLGASTFVPYGTFAFENKELLSYNQTISASTHEGLAEGIIHIDGYEYIGYFKEAELHPSRPASVEKPQLPVENQSSKEIEKTEVVQERPAVAPETVVEKPVVETPVAPAVEEKPVSEKPQTRQEESLVEIPFETVTSPDANLVEGQTRIVTAGVNGQRRLVTKVSMVNGQEVREVIEDQVVQNPVSQVIAVGTKKEVQPAPTPVPQAEPSHQVAKGTQEEGKTGQALTQPEEEYTGVISTKGSQDPEHMMLSPVNELPELVITEKGTQEEGKEGQALTQSELPEATVESKGTQEVGKTGQALVQEQLPEYKVTEGTLVEESTTDLDYKTETTEDPTKYTDEETVVRNGEKGSQVTKTTYKTVEGVKTDQVLSTSTEVTKEPVNQQVSRGTKPIEGTLVEESLEKIPFKEVVKEDDQLKKGVEVVAQEGKEGQKKITKTFNTIKGVKTEDAPKVTEEILEAPQDKILKRGTKSFEKPVLTITAVEPKDLKRTSDVKYSLENPSKAAIKSITLTLKKGDEIVKTLNVSPDNLTASLTDLQYYKDYKIETKMVYDRGEGAEEVVLNEEPLRIDLKKVEIKNIKETSLMSVDADGNETDTSLLTEKPADVAPLYLRVTTHDNKVTRLAVDKIEEVEKDGKTLYKVTAKAPDLVQRNADNTLSEEYIHYFEKQKAKEGNVYYNFNELVKDMKANPSGEFKLGADLNAANVPTPNKEYVPGTFKGKLSSVEGQRYSIHNMTRQLFGGIEGGSVKDVNLANVDINMPWIDNISALARTVKNATVENIKVTGSITGRDGIAGLVNKLDNGGQLTNVAYIGKLTGVGDRGWDFGGMVGEIWKGNVDKGYVEADIVANKARIGGFVARSDNGSDPNGIGKYGSVRNAVTKGTIKVNTPVEVGGFLSKNWAWGKVADSVSMMKVENGEVFYGSKDIDEDGGYFSNNALERNFIVKDVSTGKRSFKFSVSNRIKEVSQDEADQKIATLGITANDYVINPLVSDTLNNVKPKSDTYKDTQDYNASRELAYRNVEKLQPFYNKEWIVNQGNKLAEGSNLLTKEVLSVTAMKGNNFVTDLTDADHILVHYADKTKDIFTISPKESKVKQVKEYSVAELGEVVYTPNMVVKDRADLISAIESKLSPVELQSDPIYQHLGRTGPNKVNAIKDLYLEESFKYVKDNLTQFVTKLVENEDHQLNTDEAAKRALVKKIDDNKAAVLLGLSYLNRYYGVKFDDFNIKELMLFKPDFYGKNVSVLDFLIKIGSKENNIKGDRTLEAYRETIGGVIGIGELNSFLDYNMRLFTSDTDLNDWFIKATKDNVYIVEPKTTTPEFADKKHRAYEGLNNDMHGKMILPLLNLKDAHMFLISTYNTMAYSSFEKYGKNTAEEREAFKAEINKVAKGQQNYLDFWSRLSLDKVRNQLLKSNNMVPTPVLDNQNYKGISTDKYGHMNSGKDVAPIRELYGPTGRYHATDWRMGAVARIYGNPYKDDSVFFMVTDMISDFGISAFTHETTHVNDRMVYLGGSRHREGTDLEAFAQGMLQSPAETSPNGDFKALGLNMAYERPNDGNQWYNTNPNDLTSRAEIDHYMKGFNDTLMLLDYLEGEAVLDKGSKELNNAWFKKVAKKLRNANTKNQYDEVRDLNAEEKEYNLTSVNDLVDKNFMTKHGPGNGTYDPTGFGSAYVTVPITAGIYGGNTSEGAPGSMSFKHNTFRMWGYFGYEKGFLNYASNMLKNESKQAGHATLGDDFIIKKVSDGKFNTLEDWKKEYFKEVVDKAKAGFNPVTIDGTTYSSYDDLKNAFSAAVDKDKATLNNGSVKFDNTVSLKEKLFKKLLQQTNSFKTSIFK